MMSTRRSRLTEADDDAWGVFTRYVAPLRGRISPSGQARLPADAKVVSPDPAPARTPPSVQRRTEAPARLGSASLTLSIGGPPAGVDKATWQRFRTGKLAAARKLDLHGMTAQRAFHALAGFLRAAHADHVRCVEVVTGRGSAIGRKDGTSDGTGNGEGIGVIRREFPSWLNRPDIRPLVLGAAHPHAANPGSVRLLLRRVR